MLENPAAPCPEDVYSITRSPEKAPEEATVVEISFEHGIPTKVHNRNDGSEVSGELAILSYLNTIGGLNGIGRLDMVENRFVGNEVARRLRDAGPADTAAGPQGSGRLNFGPRGHAASRQLSSALCRSHLQRFLVFARDRIHDGRNSSEPKNMSAAKCGSNSIKAVPTRLPAVASTRSMTKRSPPWRKKAATTTLTPRALSAYMPCA